ncbi:hypothetical protein [Aeromonas salmonicida]|uniref:hypothetical protein n=1 Tax=Aeromonas salmonicida TaxID=645 RepID=UPI002331442B|nr:hypothetical protein [Aeromonas salmonicida]WCH29179.1 hypothetical protein ONZ66_10375 [Aeromonas salmonicida]
MFGTGVISVDGWALASGSLLRGVNAQQIREVVLELGLDADRQFAPRPSEVRVCGREQSLLKADVAVELVLVLEDKRLRGVIITGFSS